MGTEAALLTFEELRELVRGRRGARLESERDIRWLGQDALAVARDSSGRLELFLAGAVLRAQMPNVEARVQYDVWSDSSGRKIPANRIRLDIGEQHDAAGALILLELIEQGYGRDPVHAFAASEPVIDLVLENVQKQRELLTGLAGELLLINAIVSRLDGKLSSRAINWWHGWGQSTRDFQIGSVGVEVKTTTASASVHHIQGWYQIERGVAVGGVQETQLFLLSMGIGWQSGEGGGWTIEGLIKSIVSKIDGVTSARFLDMVRKYGGGQLDIDRNGESYDKALKRSFMPIFERLYDMSDDAIHLPSASDLATYPQLVLDSVAFNIQLPSQVRGDRNPLSGLQRIVGSLLREYE